MIRLRQRARPRPLRTVWLWAAAVSAVVLIWGEPGEARSVSTSDRTFWTVLDWLIYGGIGLVFANVLYFAGGRRGRRKDDD